MSTGWYTASMVREPGRVRTDAAGESRESGPVTLPFDSFRPLVSRGTVTVVDVLPRESYAEGHIPGAVSLPIDDIPNEAARVLPVRTQPIVVYCGSPT